MVMASVRAAYSPSWPGVSLGCTHILVPLSNRVAKTACLMRVGTIRSMAATGRTGTVIHGSLGPFGDARLDKRGHHPRTDVDVQNGLPKRSASGVWTRRVPAAWG